MSKVTGSTHTGLFETNEYSAARQVRQSGGAEKNRKQRNATVYAGELNMAADSILAKRQRAQNQAMKMIADAFASDQKKADELKERQNHIEKLKRENDGHYSKLKDIEQMQSNLMEEYEISADSQEQQDLDLIRKAKEAAKPLSDVQLSEEEAQRYKELKEQGFTEYQNESLKLDEDLAEYRKKIEDNKIDIDREEGAIKDAYMASLKKAPMLGAKKSAEELLEAATKEMIGGLYTEAKEHLDEKAEEAQEKQKEREEEKAEEEKEKAAKEVKETVQEILIEKAKENAKDNELEQSRLRTEENQIQLDNVADKAQQTDQTEQEIKELLEKMKLLSEDLKGAAVNNAV